MAAAKIDPNPVPPKKPTALPPMSPDPVVTNQALLVGFASAARQNEQLCAQNKTLAKHVSKLEDTMDSLNADREEMKKFCRSINGIVDLVLQLQAGLEDNKEKTTRIADSVITLQGELAAHGHIRTVFPQRRRRLNFVPVSPPVVPVSPPVSPAAPVAGLPANDASLYCDEPEVP